MPSYFVPSKDESTGSGEVRTPLVGNEDYRLKVLSIDTVMRTDMGGKPVEKFTVKFAAVSFADGAPIEDINGNSVDGERWLWRDIDYQKMGFRTDGTASLARQFFLACAGIRDLTQRLPEGNTEDLIGKEIIGTVQVYTGKRDGLPRNSINAFKPIVRRRGEEVVTPVNPQPALPLPVEPDYVSDEYVAAVAALVEGTDTPDPAAIKKTRKALTPEA